LQFPQWLQTDELKVAKGELKAFQENPKATQGKVNRIEQHQGAK